ncbi:MAG: CpsD/CapB family tyrosine-protein kinase [Chloroflexota bacterium]
MVSNALVTLNDPTSAAAEAYRALRTNIEFVDDPIKTLLVTSAGPEADKEINIANLAVTLSDGGQSVILVDADLRRPSLHNLFELNNARGFTDMFRDQDAFDQPPLQTVANTTLQVLTSGPVPQIPSQILNSKKMGSVLEALSNQAEIVLFNAPPLMVVTDASLLASKVDGTLLIVKANASKRDHVKAAKSRLDKVNAKLIGAVLSNAPVDSSLQNY